MTRQILTSALVLLVLVVPVAAAGPGGPIGPSFVISNQATEELDPSVAYNRQDQEYLTVFWNDRTGNDDIRAERVAHDGDLLGGFWLAAGAGHDHRYPDVAYNDRTRQYLVVWEDYVQAAGKVRISGRLISATGGLISDEVIRGVSVNTTPARPAVAYAYTADKYLVVWEESVTSGPYTEVNIVGQVVNSDGTLSGSRFNVSVGGTGEPRRRPDVAYNRRRNDYLVVWEEKAGLGTEYDIYATLVGSSGTPGASVLPISTSADDESNPRVAALPNAASLGSYLVVWQADSSPYPMVMAHLITGDGKLDGSPHGLYPSLTGPFLVSAVAGNEESRVWLVVAKAANEPAMAQASASDLSSWTAWIPLDSGPGADHPAITSGPSGDFLVAFDRPPFGSRDIYGQLWGSRYFANLPLLPKKTYPNLVGTEEN